MFPFLQRVFWLAVCLGLAGGPAGASDWLARAWQSDDGLSDNGVVGVAQTPDGFLWVGTLGGLVRFDGATFQEFSAATVPGVPNRVVRALMLDRDGNLWVGADRGPIVHIRLDTAVAYTATEGLPDLRIVSLVQDGEGAVWAAYLDGSVFRIAEGRVTAFRPPGDDAAHGSTCLTVDRQGRLWFASGRRVGLFRDGRLETMFEAEEDFLRIAAERSGGLWICGGRRVLRFHEGRDVETLATLPTDRGRIEPSVLMEDSSGGLWIGTSSSGLFRHGTRGLLPVDVSHSEIWCLAEDHEANIWVGTGGGGLNRLRPRPLQLIGLEDGLPFESIRSATEDTSGRVWAVTHNGQVTRQEAAGWRTLTTDDGWPGATANCVAADRDGGVWIGTGGQGLHRLHEGRHTVLTRRDGLMSDAISALLVGSEGELWIGAMNPNQVQQWWNGKLRNFEMPQPSSRLIRAMAEDSHGVVWFATSEGQLLRTEGDRLVSEQAIHEGRSQSIRSLLATPDGSLWIGYAGAGIGRLKDGRYARIESSRGLHDNYVSQMLADDRGWLWAAGNRGLFQVRLRELSEAIDTPDEVVRSIVYGRGEGLPSLQASFDYFPTSLRRRDGTLWFPTRTGLAVVRPENLRDNPDPPPVLLERMAVDGVITALYDSRLSIRGPQPEPVTDLRRADRTPLLPPNHRKVDFEFAALSFTAPANVHFRYRLEGLDTEWTEALTQRSVSYSRLPAGRYRFQVTACNNAGVWNETGAVLAFEVLPFFWNTWWFRVSVLTGFTLGLVALVRYVSFRRLRAQMGRLEEQAALHRERARIAKDIHDDLGANLTQIALLGDLAHQDRSTPDKSGERIDKISATARQAIKALDEIVWAVNPRNDTLAHLIDYSGQFAHDYLRLAGIRCRLDFPDEIPARDVSTDVRHNLFLVVKESLNNIVKHAGATEVWLRVTAAAARLTLVIEDNGRGFENPPSDAGADGLRNMRQRVADIGGECRIESRSSQGTRVIVELPWQRVRDRE